MNLADDVERSIALSSGKVAEVNMEEKFTSASLDIIGKAIFDYDFGSTTRESPLIRAVYNLLREAERRAQSVVPYWNLPGATAMFRDQKDYGENLMLVNAVLDELIQAALEDPPEDGKHVSLLQYLVVTKGEDVTTRSVTQDGRGSQLRVLELQSASVVPVGLILCIFGFEWYAFNLVFVLQGLGRWQGEIFLLACVRVCFFNAAWLLALWSFLRASCSDPGFVPRWWAEQNANVRAESTITSSAGRRGPAAARSARSRGRSAPTTAASAASASCAWTTTAPGSAIAWAPTTTSISC
ncbi:unnamed protein product [Effrenium voratum]|nr:unnamed protein product [Effrenium voratum]